MGLFGKTYDWKAQLSEQEINDVIHYMEEMVDRDKFAIGFQPAEIKKGLQDRKNALEILKTKKKLSENEVSLICTCLRNEIAFRQSYGQGLEELRTLNNLGHAFSTMKAK